MKILTAASPESNFTGFYKKECKFYEPVAEFRWLVDSSTTFPLL